ALMRAARDPSGEVRMAALDVLAARQRDWPRIREIIGAEPSPEIRRFAECRLLVAETWHE
ncbi:MAG: hypothetical protein ACREQQ_09265, partial [Candidatus Binatia bacterium]